jgi:glycosyltransferase involved in cell wall biosynthesis
LSVTRKLLPGNKIELQTPLFFSNSRIVKRRIAIVLPSAQGGGAERVLLNLLKRLNRNLFDLYLIIIENSGPYLDLVPPDIHFHPLGYDRVGRAIVKLVITLRRLKPDVVLTSIGHLNLALLLIRPFLPKKVQIIVRESNMPSKSFASGFKFALIRKLYPLLYPCADRVICPGEEIKNELKIKFRIPEDKMEIIPNPILVDNIRSELESFHDPFEHDSIRLLAAGSLTWQKGFDLLVIAMKKLVKKRPEVHLTILGEGPEKNNLANQIRSLDLSDSITLAGFQKNPYPYFYHADLFVLSSRWEGLPNVVLESLACGTPVVAFECPGCIKEIIGHSSQGRLVPIGDIDAMVHAIAEMVEMSDKKCNHSLLPDRFNATSVTARYEKLLSA